MQASEGINPEEYKAGTGDNILYQSVELKIL
jgi:hypothetical protein